MSTLPELARRLSRAIDAGRGISFTAGDLDLLVVHGMNDIIQEAAGREIKLRSEERMAQRRAPSPAPPASFTTEDAARALRRAQTMTRTRGTKAAKPK